MRWKPARRVRSRKRAARTVPVPSSLETHATCCDSEQSILARFRLGAPSGRARGCIGLLCVLGMLVATARAETPTPPTGRITFEVRLHREAVADRMVVRLEARVRGEDPSQVQERLNARMQAARRSAGSDSGLTITTGSYRLRPAYRKGQPAGWVGTQELILEGSDLARLAVVMGRLQGLGLAVVDVHSRLSPALRRRLEGALVEEAVAAFRARARRLARAFGARGYTLLEARVVPEGAEAPVRPLLHVQQRSGPGTAPVLLPGRLRLGVRIQGSIRLHD